MNYTVIDVLERDEYDNGHVTGALNIPPDKLIDGAKQLSGLPLGGRIIVYCRTGSRSSVAMHILTTLGYTNVINGINRERVEAEFGIK
jgi:phage shock protein E